MVDRTTTHEPQASSGRTSSAPHTGVKRHKGCGASHGNQKKRQPTRMLYAQGLRGDCEFLCIATAVELGLFLGAVPQALLHEEGPDGDAGPAEREEQREGYEVERRHRLDSGVTQHGDMLGCVNPANAQRAHHRNDHNNNRSKRHGPLCVRSRSPHQVPSTWLSTGSCAWAQFNPWPARARDWWCPFRRHRH